MNERDVETLRSGRVTFEQFTKAHGVYFEKMARRFYNRARWAHLIVDEDDLYAIGLTAAWKAVNGYRFKCPECGRFAKDAATLAAHGEMRHGEAVKASPTLLEWVHGQVGSALDHTVTRDVRRERFVADVPTVLSSEEVSDWLDERLNQQPNQEQAVDLARLIEDARKDLRPIQLEVFAAMIGGGSPVEVIEARGYNRGQAEREAKRLRTEINLEFIYPRVAREAIEAKE